MEFSDKKGDTNGDAIVDKTDVVLMTEDVLGKADVPSIKNADMNNDGKIDITDMTRLIKAIMGE